MRLTCPNCGAQYEVPDDVIPETGRDVQCSNCGDTWFQHHADHRPDETETDDTDATELTDEESEAAEAGEDAAPDAHEVPPPPETPAATRRELDPSVAEVLREEAEREARARAAEGAPLESQPDLGLDEGDGDAARRSREARERMARLRGQPVDAPEPDAPEIDPGARRMLLPDIEEINSSLRADREDADAYDAYDTEDPYPEAPPVEGGGFRRGFLLVMALAVILLLVYIYAPQIAARLPAAEAVLADYVGFVDTLRAGLDGLVGQAMQAIGGGTPGGGGG